MIVSRAHPLFRKWFLLFLAAVVLGLLGAGGVLGAMLGYVESMPKLEALENYNPPEITRIFDRTGNTQIAEFFSERRELVRIKDVPEHVQSAFIAIEDERFYRHFGVDLKGIARALRANLETGEKGQGASTISMQVARNVVLLDRRRKFSRKFKELFTALQIERNYSKEQILEFYLNQIYFGAQAYGIQAAAKAYFNKDVKDLSIPEAAMLAGLPKAPSQLSPFRDAEKARERRNLVLKSMRRLGYIGSDNEVEQYLRSPIELNPAPRPKMEASYFADYVRSGLMKDNSMEQSSELGQMGYNIISTVDLPMQRICEEELSKGLREVEKLIEGQKEARYGVESKELGSVREKQARLARIREVRDHSIIVDLQGYSAEVPLREKLPYFNPASIIRSGNLIDIYIQDIKGRKMEAYLFDQTHVQGGCVLLDARNGEVLALVGGDDYDDPVNNGQWNRATQGGRQPGSCWKPLLYGGAFDVTDPETKAWKFTPGYVEVDEPVSYGNWTPKNYEGKYYGPTCLFGALVKSRNVPTVRLFMDVGPKRAVQVYQKYNVVKDREWDLPALAPMSLGTPNITPLELASAYCVFPNYGVGTTPTPVKRIHSPKNPSDSKVIKPEQTQVLTPQAAYMTTRILQEVVAQGTAKNTVGKWAAEQASKGRKIPEIAGKTGTTNDCFVAWFSGFTPELVLTIYVGYDQHRTMGPKMVGGGTVGPIWTPMMDRILQTRNEWKWKFDVPPGLVLRDICSKSGKLVTDSCYASGDPVFTNAAFKEGTEPTGGACDYHGGGSYAAGGPPVSEDDPESHYDTGQGTSIGERGAPVPYQQEYMQQPMQQQPPGYYR